MKKPAFTIMGLCFVIIAAFLLTTCSGGGGGGGAGGPVWLGTFEGLNLLVAWAFSGGSITEGAAADFGETLELMFSGTYTASSFSISGTASGDNGADTFTASGTVTLGSLADGSTSASGTYTMDFALDRYADQGSPDPAWSVSLIEQ